MQTVTEAKPSHPIGLQPTVNRKVVCNSQDVGEDWKKSNIDCICPKCGKHHKMPIHWIGRGTPRKFCNSCRDGSRG